ncbi:MAG: hypothetical protein EPO07_15580 [Verrucomicrobia bacterium]|nr:MAG: hypothetical protein EPO07_15580 [Verrucomicrobiota bacterium]
MKIVLKLQTLAGLLSLLFVCSHATADSIQSLLPADVIINHDAGRGNELFVTLRSEDGVDLLFNIDTGFPLTLIDKSLEPKLGKRLGTRTVATLQEKQKSGVYAEPKLYIGNTPLITGSNIFTFDFGQLSFRCGRPVMGILGMDCLKHHCIQLDFEAGKMRFLNPELTNTNELGKSYPIKLTEHGPVMQHAGLGVGKDTSLQIDTGFFADGRIKKGAVKGLDSGLQQLTECVWDGKSYTNLNVLAGENVDALGLKFLARHLVTLNFPKGVMYLKQTSVGPLVDEVFETGTAYLSKIKKAGRLPGWANGQKGWCGFPGVSSNSATFNFRKDGDSSAYHYLLCRATKDDSWKLQRAWRTDQNDKLMEEYSVP